MKKAVFSVLLFAAVIAGVNCMKARASSMGPYGFDEKGAQISTGLGIFMTSSTTLYGLAPAYTGQMVMCNTCYNGQSTPNNGGPTGSYNLCIATGTGNGAWVVASSNTLQCK